ncbi:2,3-bisphosphoglycerate-independent phosphoglycerate mutase [Parasulfuritortus cantonensis]|uniref:2,3-bisphosphoglycerate-independent phosphoglycerate mutase n=1 Tax=Parasulfuritortus cantonensis TaxID=2528202 RepID=A0A4R1B4M1_9PROT|nr:2,3-bisphosphoglycerate-independent phosphoglycerate mutase [Parasulfuritortus cantonensis]TCJ12881.1 2,3-bisphosphoglycerate-independent phosphoglycerate mutase [Parasulfuritortus cantonensis]
MPSTARPVLLVILDGFGYSEVVANNAIAAAHKPNFDHYWQTYPHTLIHASEAAVGLPSGQMGNSEVGHLNIGAGRVVYQEYTRIDRAIRAGHFYENYVLLDVIKKVKANNSALHIFGLLSDGGVHSHEGHIHAMIEMAVRGGIDKIMVHAFLDGRDTPPKCADIYIKRLQDKIDSLGKGRIATVSGRYYGMDRDKRWPRVQVAYDMIALGEAEFRAPTAMAGLEMAYARGETDEFVKPTVIAADGEEAPRMHDGDAVVFMNFRSDRARQLTKAFLQPDFDGFERKYVPKLSVYCTLTHYSDEFDVPVAFPPERIRNGFGEYIASLGLHQLRIAETEKYPHVTYFFNGGEETVYPGEDRILVKSPPVAHYDEQPEMSAYEVTDKLVEAIKSRKYDAIICNYANADMVGHTGKYEAARRAIEAVDVCLGRVVPAMLEIGGEVLISADHGNAECMVDEENHQPHTAHTTNVVPFLYIGRPAKLADTGALEDIAPTLLKMMELPQPREMTGHPLVDFDV